MIEKWKLIYANPKYPQLDFHFWVTYFLTTLSDIIL